jgi:SpoVK/Ycf46/Vps4 family AAA+-type ATPase
LDRAAVLVQAACERSLALDELLLRLARFDTTVKV